ncbi:hypothetical protein ACFVUB_17905 [Streptomyces niveus]|uniref:hypothetical protein n=1 Tax=Streptomyces niveus TaxID=193462 RepID=UPI0036DAC1D0
MQFIAHSRITRLAVGAVAAGLLAGFGAPASAATQDNTSSTAASVLGATDPQAAYAQLSETERTQFNARYLPARTVVSEMVTPADAVARESVKAGTTPNSIGSVQAAGCWYGKATGSSRAAAGNTLYTFWVENTWCSNGSSVTSNSYRTADGETSTPGWRYEGVKSKGAGIVGNQGRAWAKHLFILGVGGWDIQSPNECIRVKGSASGTAYADRVCSIM